MNPYLRKILALVAAGITVGEEVEFSDHRKYDLQHVEIRGYEGQPGPTRQISMDSGSGAGSPFSAKWDQPVSQPQRSLPWLHPALNPAFFGPDRDGYPAELFFETV
jgi:hypothetical protein